MFFRKKLYKNEFVRALILNVPIIASKFGQIVPGKQ